jgi:hypothetical protein
MRLPAASVYRESLPPSIDVSASSRFKTQTRRGFLTGAGLAAAAGVTALRAAPTAAFDRRDVPGWDGEADVIVVGSGAGGISAAIEARRSGADVLVLELFHIPGGSSSLSGGVCYMGGGTPLQKALGFEDTREHVSLPDRGGRCLCAGRQDPALPRAEPRSLRLAGRQRVAYAGLLRRERARPPRGVAHSGSDATIRIGRTRPARCAATCHPRST